jgi:hypothetical protein
MKRAVKPESWMYSPPSPLCRMPVALTQSQKGLGKPRPAPPERVCPRCTRSHWDPAGIDVCAGCRLEERKGTTT